jgi:hypothetical protein
MALTDEDKAWIAAQLTQHFGTLRNESIERAGTLRSELIERISAVRSELIERIERTETTLLTEFHKWASPVELRQRSHSAAMRAFDAELEAVSDRVTNLEGRKPPAA